MSDLLSEGLDWLEEELFAHAARTVTYEGEGGTYSLPALVGKLDTDTLDAQDLELAATARRFQFHITDMNALGIKPKRGDKIRLPVKTGTAIYEITGPPAAQPHWDRLIEVIATYLRTE